MSDHLSSLLARITIQRQIGRTRYFAEHLGDGITLNMIFIPGGSFQMGSPVTEERSSDRERPRQEVRVPPFLIGQYPVTQAQWRAVAAFPRINRDLKPDPSRFTGNDLPVERVSWYDAVEFCDRLTVHTNRPYRLPSEAQWEYACRAGTTTPFHFGKTISTDLANYRGTDWKIGDTTYPGYYGPGNRGEYREKTTPVGYFKVANAFGLYDMHGNVWEWCEDDWHDSYEGAPTDGTAWIAENGGKSPGKLLRGGSWLLNPNACRSACRAGDDPAHDVNDVGFRVSCAVSRTL
jgi:formylglycine-generating enzyme required for sulfatase activity